jgi:hypothetical protein
LSIFIKTIRQLPIKLTADLERKISFVDLCWPRVPAGCRSARL